MKARVKGTTVVVDVFFDKDALNNGYPPYRAGGGVYFYPEQLVWIDNEQNTEPSYWDKLHHQAAIATMQGVLANNELWCDIMRGVYPPERQKHLVQEVNKYATELINQFKVDKS